MAPNENERAFFDSLGGQFNALFDSPGAKLVGILFVVLILFAVAYYFLFPIRRHLSFLWYRFWKSLRGVPTSTSERIETRQMEVVILRQGEKPRTGRILNINRTGFFVKLAPPLKSRDLFAFHFDLDRTTRISASALVLRVQGNAAAGTPVGMGCRFVDLSDDQSKAIASFLSAQP